MNQRLLRQMEEIEPSTAFPHPALWLTTNRNSQRSRVLVIADDDTLRQYLCDRFNTTYQIVVATNSREGLEMTMNMSPDLIITGLTKAVSESESLCFRLKQSDKTAHIPVLILSDQQGPSSRVKFFSFGADDYLTWPFLLVELQIRVHNLIQSRKLLQQKYSARWNSTSSFGTVESVDRLFLQRALTVVEDHLKDSQFGLELFAKEMDLSPRQLRRKLIALSGIQTNEFIRRVRLLRAGELLAKHAGKVSQVAFQVGFNNLSYFTKCFKTFHGSLPNEYAKRNVA